MRIATIWIKQSDWLKIRNGHGILIYSAGQGLNTVFNIIAVIRIALIWNILKLVDVSPLTYMWTMMAKTSLHIRAEWSSELLLLTYRTIGYYKNVSTRLCSMRSISLAFMFTYDVTIFAHNHHHISYVCRFLLIAHGQHNKILPLPLSGQIQQTTNSSYFFSSSSSSENRIWHQVSWKLSPEEETICMKWQILFSGIRYENTPIQIYRKFHLKNWNFSDTKNQIFFTFLLKT